MEGDGNVEAPVAATETVGDQGEGTLASGWDNDLGAGGDSYDKYKVGGPYDNYGDGNPGGDAYLRAALDDPSYGEDSPGARERAAEAIRSYEDQSAT